MWPSCVPRLWSECWLGSPRVAPPVSPLTGWVAVGGASRALGPRVFVPQGCWLQAAPVPRCLEPFVLGAAPRVTTVFTKHSTPGKAEGQRDGSHHL